MSMPKLNAPAEIHWRRSNMNTRDPILMKSVEVLKDCRSLNAAAEINCPMSRSVEKVPIRNEKRCTIIVYRPRDYRSLLTGCSLTLTLPRPHLPPSACLGWVGRSSGPQTARQSPGQAGWRPRCRVSLLSRETVHQRHVPDGFRSEIVRDGRTAWETYALRTDKNVN